LKYNTGLVLWKFFGGADQNSTSSH